MKDQGIQYDVTEINEGPETIDYIFLSQDYYGENAMVKVIQYAQIFDSKDQCKYYNGKVIYNLGFGDFDPMTQESDDRNVTGNKDTYTVFNTVLGTVPLFFSKFPGSAVMVEGSDSQPEFEAECRKSCRKQCLAQCRKAHQRITIYCNYVSKNLPELGLAYQFIGGTRNELAWFHFENFIPYKKYDTVVVYKK